MVLVMLPLEDLVAAAVQQDLVKSLLLSDLVLLEILVVLVHLKETPVEKLVMMHQISLLEVEAAVPEALVVMQLHKVLMELVVSAVMVRLLQLMEQLQLGLVVVVEVLMDHLALLVLVDLVVVVMVGMDLQTLLEEMEQQIQVLEVVEDRVQVLVVPVSSSLLTQPLDARPQMPYNTGVFNETR
jgi:hypothetical protein